MISKVFRTLFYNCLKYNATAQIWLLKNMHILAYGSIELSKSRLSKDDHITV